MGNIIKEEAEVPASAAEIQSSSRQELPKHWIQERIRLLWIYNSSRLSKNILRAVCDYLIAPSLLVAIKHRHLRCFDVTQQVWKRLCYLNTDLSTIYEICYTLTACSRNTFAVCGGLPNQRAAHLIDYGIVTTLRDLLHARYSHGAVYIPLCHRVYVLGGADCARIADCECLDLHSLSWQGIASMHKQRADFNPLLYGHLVYVVGGDRTCTMESYDWRKDCFTLLPAIKTSSTDHVLSVVTGDSILCISEHFNYRIHVRTGRLLDKYKHEKIDICSAVSMVKSDQVVYFADGNKCTSYSLANGTKVSTVIDF